MRTSTLPAGSGSGPGLGAMTYEPGQTDTDAKPIGPDPALEYPARAEREFVIGADVVGPAFDLLPRSALPVVAVQPQPMQTSPDGRPGAALASVPSRKFVE